MAAHRGDRRAAARSRARKDLDPEYNRQLRRPERLCGFAFDGKRLRLAAAAEIDADTLPYVYGVWRSRRAALQALRAAADEHRLCLQTLGFDLEARALPASPARPLRRRVRGKEASTSPRPRGRRSRR